MKIGNWFLVWMTLEHILTHPDEHNQAYWWLPESPLPEDELCGDDLCETCYGTPTCATTRCLAGWLSWFSGWRPYPEHELSHMVERDGVIVHVEDSALMALDLDPWIFGDDFNEDDRSPEMTELAQSLFVWELTVDNILAEIRDLARADGVTPTPTIINHMTARGVITDWTNL